MRPRDRWVGIAAVLGAALGSPLLAAAAETGSPAAGRYERSQPHMGTTFKLVFYAPDEAAAERAAAAAFARVERLDALLSDYDADSELSRLSRTAGSGRPVAVSPELWDVLSRAQRLAARTEGAFDVTVGPQVRLWRRARRSGRLPTPERLAEAAARVGYRHLAFDGGARTVELRVAGMRLDLGAIGKGYAADEALRALCAEGVTQALVDAGGDLALGDPPPGRSGWKVGVAPLEADAPPSLFLSLACCAVATSGDAFQFVEIDGRRYSHLVDPRTGMGLTRRSSVTVVAPDGATADSLASSVSVLGPEAGLRLVESTCHAAALVVTEREGRSVTHHSRRMEKLPRVGR